MKKLLSIILMLMTMAIAQAQTTTVKGNVTDEHGEPLIGATVKAIGKTGGTVTDLDGNYSMNVDKSVKQVEVSYIGYRTQKVNIKNGTANVQMREDGNQLDELVVIGYGSVKKGDVTAAVAQVKGDELSDRPVANIASALQGELAGVDIQSTSGEPGGSVQVKVRGATSINEDGSSNPLYVVDGVPMDDGFDLMQLNPQDIESIEVLKDASSSAIYGSRGANGVVIITQKRGSKNDKLSVQATVTMSLSTPERYMPVQTASEWMDWRKMYNYQNYINGNPGTGAVAGDSYLKQVIIRGGGADVSQVIDPRWDMPGYGGLTTVDWQKAMYRTALTQNYNVSIQQGNDNSNYRASVGYINQDGIMVNTGYRRLNAKLNGRTTIAKKLQLGVDLSAQYSVTNAGDTDGKDKTSQYALTMVPIVESKDGLNTGVEGYGARYMYAGSTVSPVAMMENRYYRKEQIRIMGSAFAKYDILPGLQAEVLGSWIFNNNDSKTFTPSTVTQNHSLEYTTSNWNGARGHKYLLQATATYDHTWAEKHHLNVVAGWSMESSQDNTSYTMGAKQFPNNSLMGWTITDVTPTSFTAKYSTDDHLVSYFARAEYSYDSRYLLHVSLRRDGSSRFGKNRKWGTFPAASLAWRISNEHFWKKNWWVNQAKVRVSYGSNGMNSIPANAADGMMTESYYSNTSGQTLSGYIPASTDNTELGWQKTYSWNVGTDISLFNNRISFAFDYYVKTIKDMLYRVTLPSVVGYSSAYDNIGNIRTKGIELEVKTENLVGKLKWTTKFSIGHSTNKVVSLGNNDNMPAGYDKSSGGTQIISVGHPVGEYYLYIADGVYMTEEDLKKYPTQAMSEVGQVRYRDINGDGHIDENDRTYCGKPQPSWTYGMTNLFKWKNWDASFLITAQTGGKIWQSLGRAFNWQGRNQSTNHLDIWKDMWVSEQQPGNGIVPRASSTTAYEEYSTRWLYSTDFIKLKNITIGYRLRFKKKSSIVKSMRFTASCENVFMLSAYKHGYSPEANNSGSKIDVYDYASYPLQRTFSLGVNATF